MSLTDRVWGWDSDHAMMRKVGLEAVRAHPGAYARGVADTFLEEPLQPLHVALPARANTAATPGSAPAPALGVDASGKAVGGAVSPLPVPTDHAQIPVAHQGIFSIDGSAADVIAHRRAFADERERRRRPPWQAEPGARAPPYPAAPGSRSSSAARRSSIRRCSWPQGLSAAAQAARASRSPLALAVGGLLVTLLNALTIYLIIEFAVPIVPALVVFAAAGLVGERRTIVTRAAEANVLACRASS